MLPPLLLGLGKFGWFRSAVMIFLLICAGAVEPQAAEPTATGRSAGPGNSSDRAYLDEPDPVAAGPDGRASSGPARLRLTTNPPGVSFEILASAYETPNARILHSGRTPVTIQKMAPGAYRVRLTAPGVPQRSASIQVAPRGETAFEQDFPGGVLKVRSQPRGAEVFCDDRLVGLTPATLAVLPGKHQIRARWGGRMARPKTVQIVTDRARSVSFDFTPPATPRPAKPVAPVQEKSMWEKVGGKVKSLVKGAGRALDW